MPPSTATNAGLAVSGGQGQKGTCSANRADQALIKDGFIVKLSFDMGNTPE